MLAQMRAITVADILAPGDVFRLIGYIHDQPRDLPRTAARFDNYGHNIRKRAIELRYEVLADDHLLLIPTNLAGDEQ